MTLLHLFRFALLTSVALALAASGFAVGRRGSFSAEEELVIEKEWPIYEETPSGLRYVVQKEGTGDKARRGMKVSVVYTAFLMDGTKFNENLNREDPFSFRLGVEDVIQGWEEAFSDMRKGEIRVLIIPHELGYGLRGLSDKVPRRSALVFYVEVIDISS
ncbi:MAG: FKBP-type peptidyl-prolyl cis-trans isomerase [Verrucomicrobia bacterium]|nr:MAG: FKBP-type peptidyl-prolyl cis-trans isomerase [Verrucomicrobiota bacterium]